MDYRKSATLFLLITAPAFAQVVGGSISGTIKDETGAGIPAAQVILRNSENGAERKLASDESGRYAAPSVAVGRYEVSASKENFQSQTKTGIELVVDNRPR